MAMVMFFRTFCRTGAASETEASHIGDGVEGADNEPVHAEGHVGSPVCGPEEDKDKDDEILSEGSGVPHICETQKITKLNCCSVWTIPMR